MAPKKFEAILEMLISIRASETNNPPAEPAFQQCSKTDAWNIAVADGDFGIGQKQAVNTSQKATEQYAHGRKGGSGGLGHLSLSGCGDAIVVPASPRHVMYTVYQRQRSCLHGSILLCAMQHER
jgi:hypothetical protein